MDRERPGLAELLTQLVITLVMVWSVLPPQDRMWLRLRAAWMTRRLLGVLAAREGRAGMGDELAGRDPSPRYGAALWLGRWRDRVAEAMRP